MVAVPRSKGCITCRKRHIKCDETKPECARCLRAGYTCAGYERALVFRNVTTAAPPREPTPHESSQSVVLEVPLSMSLVAFKGDICFSHLFYNFVWRTYGTPWLERAAEGGLGDVAYETKRAHSLVHFGKNNGQTSIQIEGIAFYNRALQGLIPALSSTDGDRKETLLVPMLTHLIYSSALGDRAGSVSHVKGIIMLLSSCGPAKFQDPLVRSAFESCRATLVTMSLLTKRRLFLEDQAWQHLPWAADPSSKSNQSQLVDVLVSIPGILEDAATLTEGGNSLHRLELLKRTTIELEALYLWRWNWEMENATTIINRPTIGASRSAQGHQAFENQLEFQTLDQASELMLYNAALLWILGLFWRLEPEDAGVLIRDCAASTKAAYGLHGESSGYRNSLFLPGEIVTLRGAATEICRALEYHINRIPNDLSSCLFYLFPIGMAWSVFKSLGDEDAVGRIVGILNASDITRVMSPATTRMEWAVFTASLRSIYRTASTQPRMFPFSC